MKKWTCKEQLALRLSRLRRHFCELKSLIPYYFLYFVLGLIFALVAAIWHHNILYPWQPIHWDQITVEIIKEVAIALFIVGCVSITIECSEFTHYFLNKLTDIMIRDEYIKSLTPNKLRDLLERIETRLFFHGKQFDSDHYIRSARNEMVKLVDDYYIDSFNILVECEFCTDRIEYTIYRRMEIINPKENPHENYTLITIPIHALLSTFGKYQDPKDVYNIESILLDDEDITDTALLKCDYKPITEKEDPKYNLKVTCNYKPPVSGRRVTIQTKTKTKVPLNERNFVNRVIKPTKNYELTFLLNTPGYIIEGYGFGFISAKERLVQTKLKNGLKISFNTWIFPGEGVLISFMPNQKSL